MCLSTVGSFLFGKLYPVTLVGYLVWRLKNIKHDNILLSSSYLHSGDMRDCFVFAGLGQVVLVIIQLWYTIQLFVRNTSPVDLNVQTVESLGLDSLLYCDSLMPVRFEFFMLFYNDYCKSFKSWFPASSDFSFRYHGQLCNFIHGLLVKVYYSPCLPLTFEW